MREARKKAASAERLIEEELREQRYEDKRISKVLKKQKRRDKIASELGTRSDKVLTEKEQREDIARSKLEQFNNLVNKFFLYRGEVGEDGQLLNEEEEGKFELFFVINTYQNKTKDRFLATAMKHYGEDSSPLTQDQQTITIPILGPNGVRALIAEYDIRRSVPEGMKLPLSDLEWMRVQEFEWNEEWKHEEGDLDYRDLFVKLAEGGEITIVNPRHASQRLKLTRNQILQTSEGTTPIQMGPLKRKIDWTHKTQTLEWPILIKREGQVILVPERFRRLCMHEFHEDLGHPGQKRMLKTLGMKYHWQNINHDVKEYVKICHYCRSRKVHNAVAKPPVQAYDWPSRPFGRTHMDLTELNTTIRGYKYILAVKDALTKL